MSIVGWKSVVTPPNKTVRVTFSFSSRTQTLEVSSSLSLEDAMKQFLQAIGYNNPIMIQTLIVTLHGSSSALSKLDASVGSLAQNFQLAVDCWRISC